MRELAGSHRGGRRRGAFSELTVIGSPVYTRVDHERAIRLVAGGQVKGNDLVTDIRGLADINRRLASLMAPDSPDAKVLVDLQR
jgi:threonine dehydrogenase-like Zn-dependent dehydrogenase